MTRSGLLLVFAAMLAAEPARAERLTIALSTQDIRINSNFTGAALTLFGVIAGDNGENPPAGTEYKVAVLFIGPRDTVVARRKDRVLGIWANRGAQTIIGPPMFYSLHTSDPVMELASQPVLSRLQIGFDHLAFVYEARALVNDAGAAEFRDAFIRLKQGERLFNEAEDVGFVGDLVFRATAQLPANIPVGPYTAVAYLFADGELVAHADQRIEVQKTGFEATMSSFARNQSLVYGILCVMIALFVGWLGGVIFRRD